VGLSCGAILSGWLAESFGWRSVMLSPGAISLIALGIAAPGMRESRNPDAMGLDVAGTVTFTGALSLLTLGVLQAPDSGWGSPWVIAALAGAMLMGAAFIAIERRVAHPMLDLSLFRFPRFVGVQLLAAAPAYGFVVLLVLLPIRFIGLEGRSALEAGSFMFALSGPILVVPTLAASLAHRFPAGAISAVGLLVCAAGLFWLSRCAPGTPLHAIVWPLLLIGAGIGLPWGLMDGLAVSVVPRERAGMASGIFNTVRVAGEGIALALVGAGLHGTGRMAARPPAGASRRDIAGGTADDDGRLVAGPRAVAGRGPRGAVAGLRRGLRHAAVRAGRCHGADGDGGVRVPAGRDARRGWGGGFGVLGLLNGGVRRGARRHKKTVDLPVQ